MSKSFKQIVCAYIYACTYINLHKPPPCCYTTKLTSKVKDTWFHCKSNTKTLQIVSHKHIAM